MSPMRRNAANWAVAAVLACLGLVLAGLASAGADEPAGPSGDHLVASRLSVNGNAQAVTLVRFNGAGASDGVSWVLPTTPVGSNNRFTLEGDSSAVGALARSADSRYVTLAGYTQPLGTTLGNSSDTAPRVVARVDAAGQIDTSTTLSTNFTQEKIRGAVTNDGSGFWVTGHGNTASPKGGMVYAPLGSSKPTVLFTKDSVSPSNSALNNTRTVQIAGGNLYFGSEKGTAGVFRTTGLPTTAQAPTSVAAFGGDGSGPTSLLLLKHEAASSVDTMYVVQETIGIFKFSFNGSTWTNRGKVVSGAYNGVTGKVDSEGHFRLYAIQGGGAENSIVTLTDTAAFDAAPTATAPSTVSTAAAGTAYRGIAFAPHDSRPGAPTGLSVVAGNAKASLSWTKPANEGDTPVSAYEIVPYVGGKPQTPIVTPNAATSCTVEGLANGTSYTFTVAAINSSGTGAPSAPYGPVTPPGVSAPTVKLSAEYMSGTVGDPTNPYLTITASQAGGDPSKLGVDMLSTSNESVAPGVGIYEIGERADSTGFESVYAIEPAGVGYSDITFGVSGPEGPSTTVTLHYAASAESPTPETSRYFSGAADASTAIDVGDGYMLLGDDENNTLRLYQSDVSGVPVKTWSFNSQMGGPEEIDIEAASRSGNTIYWTGSMGNSKKGNLKPDRSILFTTQVSGSGAGTELTFGGYYRGLRGDLIQWDEENGDRFGFADGAAAGNIPKQIDGFNVEGLEFAPGSSSTAYLGFRAPLSPASAGGDAIVVPVTNLDQLATSGQNTSVHASFGEPIEMDLDGLSLREIRKNADDQYLILAGSWAAGGEQAIFSWDGVPADPPVRSPTSLPGGDSTGEEAGSWESIAQVPDPFPSGSPVQLVMDDGSADLYGDGQEAKELIPEFQKSRSDLIPVYLPGGPFNTALPAIGDGSNAGDKLTCSPGSWDGDAPLGYHYQWMRNNWGIWGGDTQTYEVVVNDEGKELRCVVTATNSLGSAIATSAPIVVDSGLHCTGADIVGAGSSLQAIAQTQIWKPQFENLRCDKGTHPTVDYESIGSAAGMREWNADGTRGSINTDLAFIGTDAAPTPAQIGNIESVAGGARLAVLPVAQTAIAIVANPPAGCEVEAITNSNLAGVFEGRIREWSKLDGAEGKCNSPIARVVRKDGSGTTLQFKNYLDVLYKKGLACTTGATEGKQSWEELEPIGPTDAPNTSWPETCSGKTLSPVIRPAGSDDDEEVKAVNATAGSIGYASLPQAKANLAGGTSILALQNNGQKAGGEANFANAASGTGANCGGIAYHGAKIYLSLENKDWSHVFGAMPSVGGKSYPLCTLTYVLAFHGYQAAGFAFGQEVTARDFLESRGSADLSSYYYSQLPSVIGSARTNPTATIISW